jgi:hypothetical protein
VAAAAAEQLLAQEVLAVEEPGLSEVVVLLQAQRLPAAVAVVPTVLLLLAQAAQAL